MTCVYELVLNKLKQNGLLKKKCQNELQSAIVFAAGTYIPSIKDQCIMKYCRFI